MQPANLLAFFSKLLPKRFRLSKEEFQEVREKGRLVSGRLVGVLLAHSSQLTADSSYPKAGLPAEASAKAGLIVSKKISNKAVVRNKLKRRIRAALQTILPSVSPALHIVVLPNRRAIGAEVKELEEDLRNILLISKQ